MHECVVPGVGNITKELLNVFQPGRLRDQVQAEVNQRKVATYNYNHERRNLSFGRLRMQVDATVYHYWGQRLGYECWRDKTFLAEFEKANPEVKVKSKSVNASILVPGKPRDPQDKYLIKK